MKRTAAVVLVILTVFLVGAAPIFGVRADAAGPILVTAYRQAGWGDAVRIGYIDGDGGMWFIEGHDNELEWPRALSDQLAWIEGAKGFAYIGALDDEEMFRLNSLVQCVEDRGSDSSPAANDAGTEISYAVRYSRDAAETVLLGASGDDRFENGSPDAQALYLYLREAFPNVTSYFGNPVMAPAGFEPVSLTEFCGYGGIELSGLKVERTEIDCEEGAKSVTLSDGEADEIRERILGLRVVGKHSCIVTTGGCVVYSFTDENGKPAASFEFYRGLLATRDGMYEVK